MKQLAITIISVLYFLPLAIGQNNVLKAYSGQGSFNYITMTTSANNDAVIASHYTAGSNTNLAITKIDGGGNVVWSKLYATAGDVFVPVTMASTAFDETVVLSIDSVLLEQIQIMKINSSGNVLWAKSFYSKFYNSTVSPPIHLMPDGSMYVSHLSTDSLLVKKINASGDIQWQKTYVQPFPAAMVPSAIIHHGSALYIGGYDVNSYTGFLIKADTAGNLIWSKYSVGSVSATLNLSPTTSGNVLLSTITGTDTKVASMNQNGGVNWSRTLPYTRPKMSQLSANRIGLCYADSGVLKSVIVDTLGNMIQGKIYGQPVTEDMFAATAIQGTGFWVSSISNNKIVLMKADESGNTDCSMSQLSLTSTPHNFSPADLGTAASNGIAAMNNMAYTVQNISLSDSNLCGLVVPVKLVSFSGIRHGQAVRLKWKVENEQNFDRYEVERSTNGSEFHRIATVRPNASGRYDYTDPSAKAPIVFYRLKMIDKDGSYSYSSTITVQTHQNEEVVLYPNPAKDKIFITGLNYKTATIHDVSGRVVFTSSKLPITSVDVSSLPPGTYTLRLLDVSGHYFSKLFSKQ